MTRTTPAAFYFDLSSPLAYLAAERVLHVLPGPAEWRPILANGLAASASPDASPSAATSDVARAQDEASAQGEARAQREARAQGERSIPRAEVERRARALDLQPIRWPEPFPFDSSLAMRVATYAASIGRAVPFAQAAFRQAFAGGHSLEDPDFVLIAAAACEMHPAAVLRGAELRSTSERLAATTAAAARAGVLDVPAIVAGELVFSGEDMLERAAKQLGGEATHAPADGAVDAAGAAHPAQGDAGVASGVAYELHVQRSEAAAG